MPIAGRIIAGVLLLVSLAMGQTTQPSPALDEIAASAVRESVEQFKEQNLKESEVAVTIIDMRDPSLHPCGSFRGNAGMYPASVVKLFYLVATHQQLEDAKLQDSDELRRGMKDMIVTSNNDATGYILDTITDAPNGSVLPPEEMKQWGEKRNSVNRFFTSLGYTGINVNQKAYCQGPYGREKIFIAGNSNSLTTDATARLLWEIVLGKAVNAERSKQMMKLLQRDPTGKSSDPDDQSHGFTAMSLPEGSKLWSKAGWTSTSRHDATYIELPDGRKLILAIFTSGHGRQRQILPAIAKRVLDRFQ